MQLAARGFRRLGYDTSEGGYRAGVNGIAAPLWDAGGSVVASIAISGPEERLGREYLVELSQDLLDVASANSGSLGYLGSDMPRQAGALPV